MFSTLGLTYELATLSVSEAEGLLWSVYVPEVYILPDFCDTTAPMADNCTKHSKSLQENVVFLTHVPLPNVKFPF